MHHDGALATLVANKAVTEFASAAPYFDQIQSDPGPAFGMRFLVRSKSYSRIYDLDTSNRTNRAFGLAKTWRQRLGVDSLTPWCGTAKGCAFPNANPDRTAMHHSDRLMSQIEVAGIKENPPASLAWVSRAVGTFSLAVSRSSYLSSILEGSTASNGHQHDTRKWHLPSVSGRSWSVNAKRQIL